MWIRQYGSKMVAINDAAVALFGYPREELKHQSWADQLPRLNEQQYGDMWAALKKDGAIHVHVTLQTKDGALPANVVAFQTHINHAEAALILVLATGEEALRRHAMQQKLQRLTAREREVVALIERSGYTPQGVQDALHISKRTVQAHMEHILEKLDLASVAELIHLLKSIDSLR